MIIADASPALDAEEVELDLPRILAAGDDVALISTSVSRKNPSAAHVSTLPGALGMGVAWKTLPR
jgi:hypothetical protein